MAPVPKVSLITPSYNQADFLEQTIQSVLAQDYPNVEYLIIDGGSTDRSVDIIRSYQEHLAYWISEPDQGQADAINKGFAQAKGDYIGWLNSDDLLYPSAISRMVEALQTNPEVDFVYGDVDQGTEGGCISPYRGAETSFSDMLRTLEVPIPQQGSLWRRTVNERVGGLDPKWHVVLDREFFLRIAQHGRIRYVPGRLGFFRHHPESKSMALQHRWLDELPPLYQTFFRQPGLSAEILSLRQETLGMLYIQCAVLALKNRLWSRAVSDIARALVTDPLVPGRKGLRRMLMRFIVRRFASRDEETQDTVAIPSPSAGGSKTPF